MSKKLHPPGPSTDVDKVWLGFTYWDAGVISPWLGKRHIWVK
ncbi:hypothetical protein O9929_10885 [Vibrio lentus]|nr:hypothetical protein [Vibrio lentus]